MMRGWRTVTFNVLAAIVPVLQLTEVAAVIPAEYLDWYMLGVVFANLALRAVTTGPVGKA